MKLAIDASNIRSGGGLNHIVNLLDHATPENYGFNETYIWGSDNTLNKITDKPWLKKRSNFFLNSNLFLRFFWRIIYLPSELKISKCDVLFSPGGIYVGRFKPFVTMCRNMLPFEWKELRRFGFSLLTFKLIIVRLFQTYSFKRAQGIIFLSEYAQKYISLKINLDKVDTKVIPHGVNYFFTEVGARKDFHSASTDAARNVSIIKIICVSIIAEYKHQWNVIQAVYQLRKDNFPVVIEFVGPNYRKAYKRFSKAMNYYDPNREFCTYTGNLPNAALPGKYSTADIFLYSSSCENLPNILLEAMASGLPIASSNRGPMPEILGDSAVYFNPEDPDEIYIALLNIISSKVKRQELARKSYNKSKQYSWIRCANETFEFLQKIIKK